MQSQPAAVPDESRILHSLHDIPSSVGQVSTGPLGAVARRDHTSWKTKGLADPGYWVGRVDCALGEWVKDRPIPSILICVGAGVIAGLFWHSPEP